MKSEYKKRNIAMTRSVGVLSQGRQENVVLGAMLIRPFPVAESPDYAGKKCFEYGGQADCCSAGKRRCPGDEPGLSGPGLVHDDIAFFDNFAVLGHF